MGHSYSLICGCGWLAFVEAGHSRRAAARHFGVSDSFAIKLMQRRQRLAGTGPPGPPVGGRQAGGL